MGTVTREPSESTRSWLSWGEAFTPGVGAGDKRQLHAVVSQDPFRLAITSPDRI